MLPGTRSPCGGHPVVVTLQRLPCGGHLLHPGACGATPARAECRPPQDPGSVTNVGFASAASAAQSGCSSPNQHGVSLHCHLLSFEEKRDAGERASAARSPYSVWSPRPEEGLTSLQDGWTDVLRRCRRKPPRSQNHQPPHQQTPTGTHHTGRHLDSQAHTLGKAALRGGMLGAGMLGASGTPFSVPSLMACLPSTSKGAGFAGGTRGPRVSESRSLSSGSPHPGQEKRTRKSAT